VGLPTVRAAPIAGDGPFTHPEVAARPRDGHRGL